MNSQSLIPIFFVPEFQFHKKYINNRYQQEIKYLVTFEKKKKKKEANDISCEFHRLEYDLFH